MVVAAEDEDRHGRVHLADGAHDDAPLRVGLGAQRHVADCEQKRAPGQRAERRKGRRAVRAGGEAGRATHRAGRSRVRQRSPRGTRAP